MQRAERNTQSVADLDGILTRGRSSFPYFMLMAIEGGSILRGVVLMLVTSIVWLLYHFVSEEAGIKKKDAANIKRLLEAGHLGIHPEGTTSKEPMLLRFNVLFAELLEQIVPMAILPKMSMSHANMIHEYKVFAPALRGYLSGTAIAGADICLQEVALRSGRQEVALQGLVILSLVKFITQVVEADLWDPHSLPNAHIVIIRDISSGVPELVSRRCCLHVALGYGVKPCRYTMESSNGRTLTSSKSLDAHMRQLVPERVSEDDKLVEYDFLLLDRFLDVLQDLHGEDMKETVQRCYELAGEYGSSEGHVDFEKLEELANVLNSLDPGNSIVVSSSFSHMLNLGNLAEEVQIAHRRRLKTKSGDIGDENCALTESDIDETFRRLVYELHKSPKEIFDALKCQTVDLVLTAHPTQSVRRSLLQKHGRIRTCLSQLYEPGITPDEKRELDEALQREIHAAFRTDEIRRTPPAPQDEMRAGMSYFHETIWNGLPMFLRRVDTALSNIGVDERLPYNVPLMQFSSWMGGDRDGNPRVTPEVTRDVCLLARLMAANLYYSQIEDLMFEKVKFDRQKAPGLLQPLPIPDKPWESFAMDFIFDLPRTETRNDGIWTIICRFSKQAHFIPVRKKIKLDQMARLLMSNIFKYHGMPQSIVSDCDPRMIGVFWRGFFENMGTPLKFSSSFHPQTDGQSEEANSTVLDLLKCYVSEHKGKWEQYLPLVEYAYNNTVHSSTSKAPFEIVESGKKVPPIRIQRKRSLKQISIFRTWMKCTRRRYVRKFAEIASPLHMLTQKAVLFSWGVTEVTAFQTLKDKMTTGPVLILPDLQKSFEVYCDTCGCSLGAVLMQEGRVIAYESRMFSKPEMTAQIYEKELFAVIHALIQWRHYLLGADFTVFTDALLLVTEAAFGEADAVGKHLVTVSLPDCPCAGTKECGGRCFVSETVGSGYFRDSSQYLRGYDRSVCHGSRFCRYFHSDTGWGDSSGIFLAGRLLDVKDYVVRYTTIARKGYDRMPLSTL
ncbi:hypothetical protein L7F22_026470 [Adiantum nelumboides]|nr:hypothetical protein [Adiantum nelumboides]